jgi:hypothetical protein
VHQLGMVVVIVNDENALSRQVREPDKVGHRLSKLTYTQPQTVGRLPVDVPTVQGERPTSILVMITELEPDGIARPMEDHSPAVRQFDLHLGLLRFDR